MFYKKSLDSMLAFHEGKYIIARERRMFYVNEIGARIYELCNGKNSKEDIIQKIAKKFRVSEENINQDIEEYIENLLQSKIIEAKN